MEGRGKANVKLFGKNRKAIVLLLSVVLPASTGYGAEPRARTPARVANVSSELLQALRYRLIGPFRGGRVNTVSGLASDRNTYYFGAAAGGVWKTEDAGVTWRPIFDDQPVSAIGSIAVAPSDQNVIYVGTGDPNLRGNAVHGNGVYRSTDAGRTWTHLGLSDSRHIGEVLVHPRDPDVAWVAALGHAFGDNEERGVFLTKDGGRSWKRTLFVDQRTGVVDLALDPANPRILFTTAWQVRRTPHSLESGGPGSGLYRSADGGESWTRLEGGGLPDGIWGRAGVTISPADPDRVYAVIEAEDRGLYRSDDGGRTFRLVNKSHALTQRAWFFMRMTPDPSNADVLYVNNINLLRSVDGGLTFRVMDQYHVDNHGIWIDPDDPKRMISGNDGGANITVNGGLSWTRSDNNQPTGQFYRVTTDGQFPYHVYGGQQDFETIAVASRGRGAGITESDWYPVGGCEMGWTAVDSRDANIVYAGCTDGGITRYDHRTRRSQSIEPWPETFIGHGAIDAKYRFQWTAPILLSPHDPQTLYMAANVLFRSADEGMSWSVVSPDLTRNDPETLQPSGGALIRDNVGTEYYGTIFALDESPREKGLLWAGSDDGRVHLSRDSGASWVDVTPPEMSPWSRVHMIDASPHAAGTAFLAVDRHQSDDYAPYVYRTDDFGWSWKLLQTGLPANDFVRVVREDPVAPGLLYAGTETGMHVSFDGGERFQSLQRNLPRAPVYDLTVEDSDLAIATHGRAFWILDDVSPLRELSAGVTGEGVHLFRPRPAYRVREAFEVLRTPAGENPPQGAIIYYALGQKREGEVAIVIKDASGAVVRRFSSADPGSPPPVSGLNRLVWDLRYPGPERIPGHILFWHAPLAPPVGPLALPGRYLVELIASGETRIAELQVLADPRLDVGKSEQDEQFAFHARLVDALSQLNRAVLRLRGLRDSLGEFHRRAEAVAEARDLALLSEELRETLNDIELSLTEPRMETGGDAFHYPTRLDNKLAILIGVVANSDRAPTAPSRDLFQDLSARVERELARLEEITGTNLPELNRRAREAGVPAVDIGEQAR